MPDRARIVSQLVFSGRAAEVFSGGILHRDLFLSNLGVLPFPSRVGNLEVMRWSGVALPTSKGEQWFSATTVNETLADLRQR
jgi:hypothetical protein